MAHRTPLTFNPTPRALLLAEDDAVSRMIVRTLLERAGHRVAVVETGLAAVEALRARAYDAVLMDLEMPRLGGLEATRLIRQEEAGRGGHVPIIALTGREVDGDAQRCREAGMDGFLSKPVPPAVLLRLIEELTGTPRASPPPAQEILDPARLLTFVGGDTGLAKEIVELFLAQCPGLWDAIEAALARGDARALTMAAHTLKGALLNLAADPASAAALRLEALGRQGLLAEASQALPALRRELARLRAVLEAGLLLP